MIPAASLDHLAVAADEEVESCVARVAAPPVEIGIFDDQDTSRAYSGPHATKQIAGLAEMLKQEPAVHSVATAGIIPVLDVQCAELHVGQSAPLGRPAAQVKLDLIHVDAGNRSLRADQSGHLQGYRAATAAEIDTAHPRSQGGPLEERRGVGPVGAGQQQEAFVTFLAAPDHIPLHRLILAPPN